MLVLYIESEKYPAQTVAFGLIITANYNIMYTHKEILSTIWIYAYTAVGIVTPLS